MRRLALSVACALASACAGAADEPAASTTAGGEQMIADNTNAPPPEPPPQTAAPAPAPRWRGRAGSGQSAEDPVSACGPRDSYVFVAAEFECPEGGNPLGGDPLAGSRARAGNVGANSRGHIIDRYRVPCPSGPVDVYVDMYGCPEMAGMLGE